MVNKVFEEQCESIMKNKLTLSKSAEESRDTLRFFYEKKGQFFKNRLIRVIHSGVVQDHSML